VQLEDYKTIRYRQEDGSSVAEIPAIPGCYALMVIADEDREEDFKLPPTAPRS
jgi:predicted RNase H-like HicB family nuclease